MPQQVDISTLVQRQVEHFSHGATLPLAFRKEQLRRFKAAIKAAEADVLKALHADLAKPPFESFASELGFVYREIDHTLQHLDSWAQVKEVSSTSGSPGESCRIYPQPRGAVLIIGPWNYPFQLLLSPLVASIAAGNCALLKPSELAPHTAAVIAKLISATFSPDYCASVLGGVAETTELLKHSFGHIFFTGSGGVGRIIMRAAAETLTPVTLELGGKSPCIIDYGVDPVLAAPRIAWGKFYNAGQTCVAPDYLLVPKAAKAQLIAALKAEISRFYGPDPQASPDFARIINQRNYDRLSALIEGNVVLGGTGDRGKLYLAPTLIDDVTMNDKVMQEEIFGPILPIIGYDDLDGALALIKQRPNPLALYLFTNKPEVEARVIREVSFGGGCINQTLMHLGNPNLPFGGVGASGMGAYHGEEGFLAFSHRKSVLKAPLNTDGAARLAPYGQRVDDLKKMFT